MRYYLDTSVAVHAIDGEAGATRWFDSATESAEVVSSRLLQTELTRYLRREGLPVGERAGVLDKTGMAVVDESVLALAESFTPHVKTLDAIHLATALAFGSDTVMVSHDANVLRLAEELGLRTLDPVSRA
ncbi:MAG: PIN domain-containing protein [Demequina sp.]|jgi:predicted nucleic acid-binding protein|nr:PIN domain-containing protein [Demequina sp.]